jgi:hypothetical protein
VLVQPLNSQTIIARVRIELVFKNLAILLTPIRGMQKAPI